MKYRTRRWLRQTPRRRVLIESLIFDTLIGLILMFGVWVFPALGLVNETQPGVAGPQWVWGTLFLISGALSACGLLFNAWSERVGLSYTAAVNVARGVAFVFMGIALWPNYAPLVISSSLVWFRVAWSAFSSAKDVYESQPPLRED